MMPRRTLLRRRSPRKRRQQLLKLTPLQLLRRQLLLPPLQLSQLRPLQLRLQLLPRPQLMEGAGAEAEVKRILTYCLLSHLTYYNLLR